MILLVLHKISCRSVAEQVPVAGPKADAVIVRPGDSVVRPSLLLEYENLVPFSLFQKLGIKRPLAKCQVSMCERTENQNGNACAFDFTIQFTIPPKPVNT